MTQHCSAEQKIDSTIVHQSNFESAAFGASIWIQKGVDLFESAKMFEPKILEVWKYWHAKSKGERTPHVPDYFHGTYFMLMSFSVENFLKAALIQRSGFKYKRDFRSCIANRKPSSKCFPQELKTHDLFVLAVKAELKLLDGEEDLLRRMSRCAEWAGRYPTPLRFEDMSSIEKFDDGEMYSLSWFGGNDISKLNAFIPSLPKRLGLHTRHWEGNDK